MRCRPRRAILRRHFSSRPRPPRCSRSSAVRHLTFKPCSMRCSGRPVGCARPTSERYDTGKVAIIGLLNGFKPEWIDHFSHYSTKPDRGSIFGRTIVDGCTTHIPDVLADPDWQRQSAQELIGFRAALGVPLVRDGQTFGVINVFRLVAGSFSAKQIELLETFADQAVIAIQNVKLFDEVQAKTRDLTEALQQQTATSEVLQIISSSPGHLTPVFDK